MAITRAQIARELYIKGGVVNPDGRRGFGGGATSGSSDKGYQGGGRDKKGSVSGSAPGAGSKSDRSNTPSGADDRSSDQQTARTYQQTGRYNPELEDLLPGDEPSTIDVKLNERETALENFKKNRPEVNLFGLSNFFKSPIQKFSNFTAAKNRPFFEGVIRAGKIPGLNFDMDEEEFEKAYKDYMSNRLAGKTDAYGNPMSGFEYGDDNTLTGNFMDNGGGDQQQTDPCLGPTGLLCSKQ